MAWLTAAYWFDTWSCRMGWPGLKRFWRSLNTYLNLMDQYYPCYRAGEIPELSRPVSAAEYREALDIARRLGLARLSG
jgi:hypothetical protein